MTSQDVVREIIRSGLLPRLAQIEKDELTKPLHTQIEALVRELARVESRWQRLKVIFAPKDCSLVPTRDPYENAMRYVRYTMGQLEVPTFQQEPPHEHDWVYHDGSRHCFGCRLTEHGSRTPPFPKETP